MFPLSTNFNCLCLKQSRFYLLTEYKYFHHDTFTIYIDNQLFASRICHPRLHNVTAVFVNMVFSNEDYNKKVIS